MTERPQHGYPLSALFVLLAVCAVLAAMFAPVVRGVVEEKIPAGMFSASMPATAFLMAILGLIVGLHHHRRGLGAGLGVATGFVMGLLIGPLALCPPEGFPKLVVAAVGGSATLVLIGVIFRLTSRTPDS